MTTVGDVDHARNGFDPHAFSPTWTPGGLDPQTVAACANSRSPRSIKEIEIAPGVFFPAWTYNGRIPGPTFRATEGERSAHPTSPTPARIRTPCTSTASIRRAWTACAGVPARFCPGTSLYEFDARPFGCHLYHCHPAAEAPHPQGLYGAFIIDPDPERHPEQREAARARLLGTPENAAGRSW